MRWLVWVALAVAGLGYWWFEYRRWQKAHVGVADVWQDSDGADTAERVARMFNA